MQVRYAEVLNLSSLLKRYWVLLSTAEGLVGLYGSFGWSQMLCCVQICVTAAAEL